VRRKRRKKVESGPEENEPVQSGRVINTNTNGNNNNNKGRRLGIGSSSNTNDNFVDMFLTESISSMLSFNTLQQTFVDSVGGFSSDILNFDKLF